MRVLIVDSSAAVRTRLGERFADEGFAVLHAETLGAALDAVGHASIATIVLDLHAARTAEPAIEGLARLRSLAPESMIVVLANDDADLVRRECLRRGADFFFDKSRDFERAVEAVVRYSATTRVS